MPDGLVLHPAPTTVIICHHLHIGLIFAAVLFDHTYIGMSIYIVCDMYVSFHHVACVGLIRTH